MMLRCDICSLVEKLFPLHWSSFISHSFLNGDWYVKEFSQIAEKLHSFKQYRPMIFVNMQHGDLGLISACYRLKAT